MRAYDLNCYTISEIEFKDILVVSNFLQIGLPNDFIKSKAMVQHQGG